MSALPEVIVDYDADNNITKFWVKSPIVDYRYDKLTIYVNNETSVSAISDTFTYCIDLAVPYREFDLNVTALTETTFYHFKCHCSIGTDIEMTFHFEYIDDDEKTQTEDVPLEDMPWKKVLWIEEL